MIDRKFKFLIIALIIVLIINSVLHFTHPAYKYYSSNVDQFRSDYNDFVRKVQDDFIPCILQYGSNVQSRASSVITNSISSLSSSASSVISSTSKTIQTIKGRYFVCGKPYFESYDYHFTFTIGDDFLGSPIVDIRPTCLLTDDCFYRIAPIANDERVSNDT